nr:cation-transporting P-type ATPase [Bdellovibrio sp. CKG001]
MDQRDQSQYVYAMTGDEVLKLLSSQVEGLSQEEVQKRQSKYGKNILPQAEGEGVLKIFFRQIHNPLIYILLSSSALAFLMGKSTDGTIVLFVVVINAFIGFFQEFRAGKAVQALSAMIPNKVRVIRDKQRLEIDSTDLVPGDIVHLYSGDKVAADMRLLEVKTLRIEEAALTGESVPTEKIISPVEKDKVVGDRLNMAFSGTLVSFGQGTGVVTGTGDRTELGRIAKLLKSATKVETPLTRSLDSIGKILTIAILIVAVVLLVISLWRGFPIVEAVLASITLAVAAIPEGLPAIITIALAIGVRRMALRKAVIRKLPAVETLGSTTVICSDKTGTLTKNEMTVQALWTPQADYRVTGVGYTNDGKILLDGIILNEPGDDIQDLLKAGVLCNDSEVVNEGENRKVQGDPTEASLIVAFEKANGVVAAIKSDHPRLDSIPFESERQYMATLHQDGNQGVLFLKGAPEVILRAVSSEEVVVNEARSRISSYAAQGMRVLAFARKTFQGHELTEAGCHGGFELLGLQAMIDPPREEVIQAIADCHRAGIVVKMITGDHPETAEAIARELNISTGKPALTGSQVEKMRDEELDGLVAHMNVFARVAPEHKLRLVKALQRTGNVTAMTGDGVNDAPALKQSDIGIAMGITGTSVSKEAADLVLLDDNFTTIRTAVEEGRRIYDNLIKSLAFVLPTNLGQAFIILIAVAFFPREEGHLLMPILPVQILWINLVASVALSLPLAFEAKEPDIMSRPPRPPKEKVLGKFVLWRTLIVALIMALGALALFRYELNVARELGHDFEDVVRKAQTMAVNTVIFFQIFYFLQCRSLKSTLFKIGVFSNPTAFLGIGSLILLQIAFVHLPFMNKFFHSGPLPVEDWLKSIAVGALVFPVIAFEKIVRQSTKR